MMDDTRGTYLPVYVATENNYFSQGVVFLLEELFEDEFSGNITVSLVKKIAGSRSHCASAISWGKSL
ncbi:Uncharacterised protein [Klebsiella michiganensis]|nr:Uncharacterised protein [Klebsiella michiganensis]